MNRFRSGSVVRRLPSQTGQHLPRRRVSKPRGVSDIRHTPGPMKDADLALTRSRRPLVIGIGGGGDVVGALATAEAARLYHGARPVLGGVAWERRPIDPVPGPRSAGEIEAAEEVGPGGLLAGPDTRLRGRDVGFGE